MMSSDIPLYPDSPAQRDRWILSQRPQRNELDPHRPYAFHIENERANSGEIVPVATVFLTNRECPWHCLMCDLWRNTLTGAVPAGAIPEQIAFALSQLPRARHIKLYNSGSFFDGQAIPSADYESIARLVAPFERIIVESHPALIGGHCLSFSGLLQGQLEVAMGLETVHPVALEKLNKRMTAAQFAKAAEYLHEHGIDLRVFLLVCPPFVPVEDAFFWTKRSLDFAFHCGATAVTLIPTRTGNEALDRLMQTGDFVPPKLRTVEDALEYGIGMKRGRVFADLWDLERFASCAACREARIARLRAMNDSQFLTDRAQCNVCGGDS